MGPQSHRCPMRLNGHSHTRSSFRRFFWCLMDETALATTATSWMFSGLTCRKAQGPQGRKAWKKTHVTCVVGWVTVKGFLQVWSHWSHVGLCCFAFAWFQFRFQFSFIFVFDNKRALRRNWNNGDGDGDKTWQNKTTFPKRRQQWQRR